MTDMPPELEHQRVTLQRGLHDAALHTAPAAVDEAHLEDACLGCGAHIFFDDRWNVTRREGVKIQFGADGNVDGIIHESHIAEGRAPTGRSSVQTCRFTP